MMGIDVFALWKFKNIEGKLKHFYASEFLTTKYINGSKRFTITYDVANQKATIKAESIDFTDILSYNVFIILFIRGDFPCLNQSI